VLGDSGSPDMANLVGSRLPPQRGPMFVILDSDHQRPHVLTSTRHPLRPDFGPDPYEALEEFLRARPGVLGRDLAREQKFGFTFAPGGYLTKT